AAIQRADTGTKRRPLRNVLYWVTAVLDGRLARLVAARPHFLDSAPAALSQPRGGGSIPASEQVFQFKITLLDSHPPIWRRIQFKDCTLDKLHEHIQTAMGWTNSHLHHFILDGQLYGDPQLMQENFEDLEYKDSTITKVGDLLPEGGKR